MDSYICIYIKLFSMIEITKYFILTQQLDAIYTFQESYLPFLHIFITRNTAFFLKCALFRS